MPHFTLKDGDKLHYDIVGAGPPLALVPGILGLASFWSQFVPALAERFTLILHDHRGCGRSTPADIDYSIDQMTADLVELLDGLGIERCSFVGHSAGGAIGQTMALDHPRRLERLVIGGSWAGPDFYVRRVCGVRLRALAESGPRAMAELTTLFMKSPWWLAAHAAELEAAEAAAERLDARSLAILRRRTEAILGFDRRADLGRIAAPALVLGARDDFAMPAYLSEELARRIPGAELILFPEGGHFFPQLFPDDYLRAVVGFLARA
jgi:aminoacrylate hydrolase